MFTIILINTLIQLFYFIGTVFIVGFLISLVNRFFYKLFPSRAVCYATGFLGTPVHELSHAAMCLVFFHRINEIKLFQIGSEDGVLGYVNHSYNKRNLYQVIGNYFIGIAPIIGGSLVLLLAMRFLAPTAFWETNACLNSFVAAQQGSSVSEIFACCAETVGNVFVAVFTAMPADGFLWWIFLLLAFCLALHMNLSGADIKGSIVGCIVLAVLIFVLNLIIGFASASAYEGYLRVTTYAGGYMFAILLLSLIFSIVMLVIGLIVKGVISLALKLARR